MSPEESPNVSGPVEVPRFFLDSNVMFPQHPIFAPGLLVRDVPRGLGIDFLGGPRRFVLRGSRAAEVFLFLREHLDGTRTVGELLTSLPHEVHGSVLLETLKILHQQGVLVDGRAAADAGRVPGPRPADNSTAYWIRKLTVTRSASSAGQIARRASAARLVIVAGGLIGELTVEMLERGGLPPSEVLSFDAPELNDEATDDEFEQASVRGVRVIARLSSALAMADLLVVAVKGATARLETALNDACLEARTPLLYSNDDGEQAEICFVDPFRSSCLNCKRMREDLVSDFALEDYLFSVAETDADGSTSPSFVHALPAGESFTAAVLVAAHVAAEAFRFATGIAPLTLANAVLQIDPLTGATQTHRILRVPRCPSCSHTPLFLDR